jgi:predicted RNase H-like HicB family nuclease
MNLTFETELETDGRWIAEVPELAGVLAYGVTEFEAIANAEALAIRVLAAREQNQPTHSPCGSGSSSSACTEDDR